VDVPRLGDLFGCRSQFDGEDEFVENLGPLFRDLE
jgi:hypothetical protein